MPTMTIQPDDTGSDFCYISSNAPTTNSHTAILAVGDSSGTLSNAVRSLVKIPVTTIPVGVTINSCTFGVWEYDAVYTGGGTAKVDMRRLLRSFGETSANWDTYDGTNSWGSVGASNTTSDIYSSISASLTMDGTSANAFVTFDVTSDVRAFYSGTYTNYGWRLRSAGEYAGTTPRKYNFFRSPSYTTAASRPYLYVDYTPNNGYHGNGILRGVSRGICGR